MGKGIDRRACEALEEDDDPSAVDGRSKEPKDFFLFANDPNLRCDSDPLAEAKRDMPGELGRELGEASDTLRGRVSLSLPFSLPFSLSLSLSRKPNPMVGKLADDDGRELL